MSWFKRLGKGLSKTAASLKSGLGNILSARALNAEQLEELEDNLIAADLGPKTAQEITLKLSKVKLTEGEDIKAIIADAIYQILINVQKEIEVSQKRPHVILMCGVNGNGKTTTTGKLASQYVSQGYKVSIAACDTYRAAAVEQLKVWADRSGASLITGEANADPASVAYKAYEDAVSKGTDILIVDTAGRLHSHSNLMEELAKIRRVLAKKDEASPHHILLVIDATTGQNAIRQVEEFKKMVDINGLIITKLDGSAKGGIVVNLAKNYKLPIYAIGVGEDIEDLGKFDAQEFSQALINSQ